jgi:nitrogen fixation/metabolism regulation signal transduction histidine kinase
MALYLWLFYQKTLRPYDTLVSGIELVRDLDLTTRLAPTGQHEADIIVRTFNELLTRLRTEHLTLEEQYTFLSLLINASPMGIVQCDVDGNITSMNPAAKQMLSPSIEEALHKLPLGQETTVRLPGEPQLFRINHLSFPDRGFQHPFYLIESLTDEVRKAEKAAYERVIRMIAHEVNNSVAGIVGIIQNSKFIIQDSSKNAKERLMDLSEFVTRFANVVKIPQPQLQLCDLSEEVDACRPFLESLCNTASVRLEFQLTDEAAPVRLDTILFQQVLINIVKNAIESIGSPLPAPPLGESPSSITISVKSTLPSQQKETLPSGSGEGASLTITDNGRGISPEAAQHLFTPFYSTKPQGQGIGLLLIRDILTSHGCTFSLLTDPTDHLTRFTINFPRL